MKPKNGLVLRLGLLSVLGTTIFMNKIGFATSCRSDPVPIEVRAKGADDIFIGKYHHYVQKFNLKTAPFGATDAVILSVKKVIKGKLGKTVEVFFKSKESMGCSRDYFNEFAYDIGRNSELLFFAKVKNGKLYISKELGFGLADGHNKDLKYLSNLK